jgi:hypothetical protein
MSILDKDNPDAREFVTEILDEAHWYGALKVIVEFLRSRKVERVRVEFGFVLDGDLEEKQQGEDQVVQLSELESFIKAGIDEGLSSRKGLQISSSTRQAWNWYSCCAMMLTCISHPLTLRCLRK